MSGRSPPDDPRYYSHGGDNGDYPLSSSSSSRPPDPRDDSPQQLQEEEAQQLQQQQQPPNRTDYGRARDAAEKKNEKAARVLPDLYDAQPNSSIKKKASDSRKRRNTCDKSTADSASGGSAMDFESRDAATLCKGSTDPVSNPGTTTTSGTSSTSAINSFYSSALGIPRVGAPPEKSAAKAAEASKKQRVSTTDLNVLRALKVSRDGFDDGGGDQGGGGGGGYQGGYGGYGGCFRTCGFSNGGFGGIIPGPIVSLHSPLQVGGLGVGGSRVGGSRAVFSESASPTASFTVVPRSPATSLTAPATAPEATGRPPRPSSIARRSSSG